ncbi:MAG: VWA domain-containing protein [Ktedonobacteraceae bacterium]|nr:VWA domain-containing protein [Ktedonobacteraceae bacterium]
MEKNLLLHYLDCRRLPLAQCEEAASLHDALCESAPQFYLHLLADSATDVSHKREILVNVLRNDAAQQVERERILAVLRLMPTREALQVLGVIRDLRINRSRARELVLAYLFGHEQLPEIAAVRRQRLARLLRHVLGERTWSSVRRFLATPTPEGEQFLQREILRYAWNSDVARAREVLCFLAGVPFDPTSDPLVRIMLARKEIDLGKGLPGETLTGLRGIYHRSVPLRWVRQLAAPSVAAIREDGPLTASYKEALSHEVEAPVATAPAHGPFAVLQRALAVFKLPGARVQQEQQVSARRLDVSALLSQEVAALPAVTGRVAVVLDLSGSMAASGERLNHPAALALALTRLLHAQVSDVRFYQTGGSVSLAGDVLPEPQGTADLADAILEAVRDNPQAILVMTDGYENTRQGDAAQIVRGLRKLGCSIPVYQVVPLFTAAEDLSLRRLGEEIPLVPITHEKGVRELLARVLLTTAGEHIAEGELQQLQALLT